MDVVDQNRALVDGPETGLPRQTINFKSLTLTPFKVKIQHGCRTGLVKKAFKEANVMQQWQQTLWYKKLCVRETRRQLGDFDRFRWMIAKKRKAAMVNGELKKRKKSVSKQ